MKMSQSICFSRGFKKPHQHYHSQGPESMVVRPQRFLYFRKVSSTHLDKKRRSCKRGKDSGMATIPAPWKQRLDNPMCLAKLDLQTNSISLLMFQFDVCTWMERRRNDFCKCLPHTSCVYNLQLLTMVHQQEVQKCPSPCARDHSDLGHRSTCLLGHLSYETRRTLQAIELRYRELF